MRRNQFVVMSKLVVLLLGVAFEAGLSADLLRTWLSSNLPPSLQVMDGTFNLQIQAIEVTQGVRGDIPIRQAPEGNLLLSSDGAVHIANRRTIVRAYPWLQTGGNLVIPPITARLWAYRDGELLPGFPISQLNGHLEGITSGQPIAEMRGDANKSWNFLLPSAWTASDSNGRPFTLNLVVEANPPGAEHEPECDGCSADNQVTLTGQIYMMVPALTIQPYFVHHTVTDRDGSQVAFPGPDLSTFERLM
jgi:hypothetical protein